MIVARDIGRPKTEAEQLCDVLNQLDDELEADRICECRCASFPDQHGPARCLKPATYYVEVHLFAKCRTAESLADPNVSDDGDKACYLCEDCKTSAEAFAQIQMANMIQKLPVGAIALCPAPPVAMGCGRPMTTLDDYIPVRRAL